MTLKELAAEYREGAHALYRRISELGELLQTEPSAEERFRLSRRIAILRSMYHDTSVTARYMERYYCGAEDRRERSA